MIVAVYIPDVEFQKVCLILELAWIELLVYEVNDHLAVSVVHVVVDDQLHSFDGHALIAIERYGLEICALEHRPLLQGRDHGIHTAYFDLDIFLRQYLGSGSMRGFFLWLVMLDQCHCVQLEPITLPVVGKYVVIHCVIGILVSLCSDSVGCPHNGHILSVEVALVLIGWLHTLLLDVDRVKVEEQERLLITT